MMLAIDVGNSRLKWALYAKAQAQAQTQAEMLSSGVCALEHIDGLAEGDWANLRATHGQPSRMLGCCVAGDAVRRRVEEQLESLDVAANWVVSRESECGLRNGYDHPTRLGSDRWVAMIGARHHMLERLQEPKYAATTIGPRPLVVVMVGTAVTVEAIAPDGSFLGGYILPGHGIMLKSLQAGTSGLHVPTGEVKTFPTNTSDALTSGGTYAIAGAIESMYSSLQHHCGIKPWCYMTGGAGWKMRPHIAVPFELIEDLIFEGLLSLEEERASLQNM
jgi:type III pantothenate kinase